MPAEWEPHEATWIAWPHNREDWPGRFAPIPWVYGEIVRNLAARGARPHPGAERGAREAGAPHAGARWARTWMRSSSSAARPTASGRATTGPLFVKNARGRDRAHRVAVQRLGQVRRLAAATPRSRHSSRKRLKLPGVHAGAWCSKAAASTSTAQGLLLTTEECLLSPVQARNPGLTAREIERALARLPGRGARDLAEERDRRRRHARPRRRPGALRRVRRRSCCCEANADANYEPLRRTAAILRGGRLEGGHAADAARRCASTASGCRPATPTSTSPTGWCWCRPSTTRTIASALNILAQAVSRIAKWSASTAPI